MKLSLELHRQPYLFLVNKLQNIRLLIWKRSMNSIEVINPIKPKPITPEKHLHLRNPFVHSSSTLQATIPYHRPLFFRTIRHVAAITHVMVL